MSIIHSNKLTYLPSFYFDRNLPQSYLIDSLGGSTDTLSPATRKILHLADQENIESASVDADRVWFIVFQQSMDEFTAQGFETHPDIDYLNKNFTLTSTEIFDDVRLYVYARRVP